MFEVQWLARHPAPVWLPEFESLAAKVIGADPVQRESAERLLKKWVDSQPDACHELLLVMQSSQSPQTIIVAVLLCKNAALKKWGQVQEGTYHQIGSKSSMLIVFSEFPSDSIIRCSS